jgi:hypothetical protein
MLFPLWRESSLTDGFLGAGLQGRDGKRSCTKHLFMISRPLETFEKRPLPVTTAKAEVDKPSESLSFLFRGNDRDG